MCEKELSKLGFDGDVKSDSSGFQVSRARSGRGACPLMRSTARLEAMCLTFLSLDCTAFSTLGFQERRQFCSRPTYIEKDVLDFQPSDNLLGNSSFEP